MDSDINHQIEARLAELQVTFVQQLPGKLAEINRCWHALSTHWTTEGLIQLHLFCHKLAGTGGTFGADELSRVAYSLEVRLKTLLDLRDSPDPDSHQVIDSLLYELSNEAKRWASGLECRTEPMGED
jgi:HPt (histidine-containing phosphotransfer) domain-containing protein